MLNFDQMEKMTLQILPYLPATLELLLLSLLLAIVLGLGATLSRIYRIPSCSVSPRPISFSDAPYRHSSSFTSSSTDCR